MRTASFPSLVAALVLLVPAAQGQSFFGQSFNVDLGPAGGAGSPAGAYGAAALQPGTWNEAETSRVLANTDGTFVSVQIVASGVGFAPVAVDNPATSGDDEALLDDGLRLTGAGSACDLDLGTIPNEGTYVVYTYVLSPDSTARTEVEIPGASIPLAIAGGTWPGFHVEGVTYTRHVVPAGMCCSIRIRPEADAGFVAGVQLVRLSDAVTRTCRGTQEACPCGNFGAGDAGCANSVNPSGGFLEPHGAQIVGSDSFWMVAGGFNPGATVLFFQGSTQVSAVVAGDGIRCTGGTLIRLGVASASGSGDAIHPGSGDGPISAHTLLQPSERRFYQAYYRDPADFCTTATFNMTNGLSVLWY